MRKDIFWAKCPFCNYIKPEITVIFGNSISSKTSYFPCSKVEKFILYSPYELKNRLKEMVDKEEYHLFVIDEFKNNYPNLFWSCIWYFHLYNLDYNIILPYEAKIFELQKEKANEINYMDSKIISKLENNYNGNAIINKNDEITKKKNTNLFVVQNIFVLL